MLSALHSFQTWFGNLTGVNNEAGPGYGFFSGIGSDIGEVVLIGGLVQLYRHHSCHVDGCRRIGRHRVDGTNYTVCKRHHPNLPEKITANHISKLHWEHIKKHAN